MWHQLAAGEVTHRCSGEVGVLARPIQYPRRCLSGPLPPWGRYINVTGHRSVAYILFISSVGGDAHRHTLASWRSSMS